MKRIAAPCWSGFLLATALMAGAAAHGEWAVGTHEEAPPEELAAFVVEQLGEQGVRVSENGEAAFDFWFVKELPLQALPEGGEAAWEQVAEATLVGAVTVHSPQRDYREDEIYEGVYTLRFGQSPVDGDHQGTSDYRYFFLLIPAAMDDSPRAVRNPNAMVELSSEDTATLHPVVLSVRPVDDTSPEGLPKKTTPVADHTAARIALPAKTEDSTHTIVFDLVFQGKGHL